MQATLSWHWSAERGTGFCLLSHELSHRWIAYTGDPLEVRSHWATGVLERPTSVLGDSVGCVMNDLELYLAGMLPADSILVPLTRNGYTIADLINRLGRRDVPLGGHRRDFTIGFIVVSEAPLSAIELAYHDHLAQEYTAPASPLAVNWAAPTGGRSGLDGLLPLGN